MEISYKIDRLVAIVVAVLMIALISCKPKLEVVERTTIEDSISVETKVKYRDTVIITPVDSAAIKAQVICDENNQPVLLEAGKPVKSLEAKGKSNARIKMSIHEGWLKSSANCDSLEQNLKLKDTTIKELRSRLTKEEKTVTVKEKYVPGWVEFFAWSGGVLWLIVIILIGIKILKPINI